MSLALLVGAAAASAQSTAESVSGSVQGVVINESGERIANATVWGFPAEDLRKQIRAQTDEQGSFVLENAPAGLFYMSAFKESDGYPYNFFAFFKNTETGRDLVPVVVEKGRRKENVAIQVGPRAASLTFHITQLDGTPLKGLGPGIKFVRDDVPGVFSTGANSPDYTMLVPAVPFHFAVEAPGYRPSNSQLITPRSGESVTVTVGLVPN